MKIFGRLRTVFFRLILSYIILILITLAIVGGTSYYYFSTNFNEQVEKVNNRILTHLSQSIEDDIINIVERNYLTLVTGDAQNTSPAMFLFDNTLEGNHSMVNAIHQQLKALTAANAAVVASVGVYYKTNNILITSDTGITYLGQEQESRLNLDWMDRIQTSSGTQWIETRKVQPHLSSDTHTSDLLTFVRPYPYTPNAANIKGYIAIHIKESVLYDIIQSSDSSQLLLLNQDGKVLSNSNKAALHEPLIGRPYIAEMLGANQTTDGFVEKVDDVKTMISYVTLPSVGWKLISMTPVDEFYKSTTLIRNMLILMCIVAIVIGVIVSNIFTMNMYNPLKRIIHNARQLFGTNQFHNENEFKFIDQVMNNLSVKVSELEQTLKTNMPVIKHNVVLGLLTSSIRSLEELNARLHMLNISWTGNANYAVTFRLDAEQMGHLPMEKSQFVKYNLIDYIEKKSCSTWLLLATEQSDQEIYMIVGSKEHDMDAVVQLVHDIASYAYSSFMIHTAAAIGRCVETPSDLHKSFEETRRLLKYQYYLPEEGVYYGDKLLQREYSREQIPEELLNRFAATLRTNKREIIREEIGAFVGLLQNGNYSADHCHDRLQEIISMIRTYIKDIHFRTDDIVGPEMLEQLARIRNIAEFERWLLIAVDATIHHVEQRSSNRTNDVIGLVKNYILSNIAAPLSLDTLADQVSLSPRYLSRVFKDEVGVNFTDFVTKQRIERASELIVSTTLNVEQIAEQVGFNSSAYFIKKFKENYGITPKNYKHHYQLGFDKKL